MALRGLKFEYNVDTLEFDACRLILLKVKENQYFLNVKKGKEVSRIEITKKVDEFCQRLQAMNIEKWDRKIFDWPMEYFIGYHWKLEVTGDGINAVCRGSDNLPNDWGAFRNALNFLGIKYSRFPF